MLFAPPILAHGQVTPNPKNWWGSILGTPHFGPLGVTCPFLQFWTPEHQRNTWTTLTRTDTQPIARKNTYLGATQKLNSFFNFPIPNTGAIYTKQTQPMARDSYTPSTLGGTEPPHRGGVRPPSSFLQYEAKEQFQFWSTPR